VPHDAFVILGGPVKTTNNAASPALERGLGLKEAVALNMIEIVGIGPFVVSSMVIRAMGGPQALIAWLAGKCWFHGPQTGSRSGCSARSRRSSSPAKRSTIGSR